MASRREQVSALFFVASTRRLAECFPWATEGPNPPKETLTFKKEFFWQTPSGSLPAGLKGELNPEMKLCELLALGHCIHLPLILFACASSGQSYNVGLPVPPNFCDVIDTAMTGDPIAF